MANETGKDEGAKQGMADDIVTRLRRDWFRPSRAWQDEAADEIVRLRAVLDAIDALHFPLQSMGTRRECAADGDDWPCSTHLLIHAEEARRG